MLKLFTLHFLLSFTVGTFSIKLPKLYAGETFENLDLLTTLLAPKKKASLNVKPLIEVVGKCSLLFCTFMIVLNCILLDYCSVQV